MRNGLVVSFLVRVVGPCMHCRVLWYHCAQALVNMGLLREWFLSAESTGRIAGTEESSEFLQGRSSAISAALPWC